MNYDLVSESPNGITATSVYDTTMVIGGAFDDASRLASELGEPGLLLLLEIDQHVADCLRDLDLSYGSTDDGWCVAAVDVRQRMKAGIDLAIGHVFDLDDDDYVVGETRLQALSAKVNEIADRLLQMIIAQDAADEILADVEPILS